MTIYSSHPKNEYEFAAGDDMGGVGGRWWGASVGSSTITNTPSGGDADSGDTVHTGWGQGVLGNLCTFPSISL